MVTIKGKNGKQIHYKLSDKIHEYENNTYTIEMPLVTCSDNKDAELIQNEVNTFIAEISNIISLKDE